MQLTCEYKLYKFSLFIKLIGKINNDSAIMMKHAATVVKLMRGNSFLQVSSMRLHGRKHTSSARGSTRGHSRELSRRDQWKYK